jgi:hypothetical protein
MTDDGDMSGSWSTWIERPSPEAFNLLLTLNGLTDPVQVSDDVELAELFALDQADRRDGVLADDVETNDQRRRRRGLEKLSVGEVRSPKDYYHLAMLLQHGSIPEHYHLGHELARRASVAGFAPAAWLAAAAMDRWLMNVGLPQKYGTQYLVIEDHWELYQVDDSTTDEERELCGVPTLAEAQERADTMNQEG